jgi:toxin CptA
MRSAPSIAFDYRPAPAIVVLAGAGVVAAASAPWFCALPIYVKAVVSIAAAAYGIVALRRFVRAGFVRITYRAAGWMLVDTTGTEHAADIASHARYGQWIALDFHVSRRRFRALVGPGNADAETRRRLILLLSRAEVVQPA